MVLYSIMKNLETVDAVILCGGKGERLRPLVSDKPKSLALVQGIPVLDILLQKLHNAGVRRFVLCVGYLKDQIREHVENITKKNPAFADSTFVFSEEYEPLGTGGALKNAAPHIKSENFLLINGDTLWSIDFSALYKKHLESRALLTLTLVRDRKTTDYGRVLLHSSGLVASFAEKGLATESSLISAGVYLASKKIFSHLPDRNSFSLEYDVFPTLASNKLCTGCVVDSHFLDIGTPERYKKAQKESFA